MAFSDESLFSGVLILFGISAAFNIVSLHFTAAPYGKHSRSDGGATMHPALAWFLMESPTLWLTVLLFPLGRHRSHPLALLTISFFLIHYAHRTLIYPLRLRLNNKSSQPQKSLTGFPVVVAVAAFVFNVLNAYLQTRSVSHYADYEKSTGAWIWVRILVGLGIFAWGMKVNVSSDLELVRLKREGGGYKIPRGGWFEWVCSPNYMGEAAEWLGWAVVAWTPAALAFFLYTCSNLVPRARAHLKWYRDKFGEDYPKSRKAIVPLLY